jgi:hypothetical protein
LPAYAAAPWALDNAAIAVRRALRFDIRAGRRLRSQPYRFGPIDGLLFLFAQLRAEDHLDFRH